MSDRKRRPVARTVRFGAAAVVAAAAGVVGFAPPASAADLTPSQLKGPVSGTNTITMTGLITGTAFPATPTVVFNSAASCPTAPGTPTGTSIVAVPAGNVTGGSTATLTVVVPGTAGAPVLAPATPYNICVYNGTTRVAATASATKYTTVAVGTATVDVARGPIAGGNPVVLTDTTTQFGPGTAVQFNSASTCPATFATPATGTIVNATIPPVTTPVTSVTATVPGTLTAPTYSVCAYTGTAATSALVSGLDAGYGLVFPITVAPATGPAAGTNTVTATATAVIFTGTPRIQFSLLPCPATHATPIAGVVVAATAAAPASGGLAVTFTAPVLLTTSYYVCVYQDAGDGNGLVASTSAPAYTAGAAGTLTLDVAGAPVGGGATVVLTDGSASFDTATRVQLNTVACPTSIGTDNGSTIVTVVPAAPTPGATSVTITSPAGLTASQYFVCAYTGSAPGSALLTGTSTAAFDAIHPFDNISVTTGPDAGGFQLTATDDQGGFTGTVGVRFTPGACPATYGAGTGVAATATVASSTSLTVNVPALAAGTHYVCAYRGNSSGSALNSETTTAAFTARNTEPITLSSANGNSGVANSFTATMPTGLFPTDAVVRFIEAPACPDVAGTVVANTNVLAGNVRRVSPGNKLAITTVSMTALSRKVCVYNVALDTLLAESTVNYVTAAGVTIDEVSPSAGPAQGGTLIRVEGANFATGLTATIGGVPLKDVTVGGGGAFFTALTPAHAPGGPFDLVISSPSGPVTEAGAFSYSYGIEVTPDTAPNTASIDISVSGVGFAGIDFTTGTPTTGDTPAAGYGHVYLAKGEYDATELHTAGFKVNDMLLECVDVLVIDDTELVCTLHLSGVGGVVGDVNATLRPAFRGSAVSATDVDVAVGSNTLTTAGDIVFTAADIGLTVDHTSLPDGTTIVQVVNATTAILSAKATLTIGGGATVDFLPPRAEDVTATSLASPTTLAGGTTFSAADVGRRVSGNGIQPGTVIEAFGDNTTVTLSKPITSDGETEVLVGEPAVPNGAYTITVVSNGAVDADRDDAEYTQSIITSTSTFTVADY